MKNKGFFRAIVSVLALIAIAAGFSSFDGNKTAFGSYADAGTSIAHYSQTVEDDVAGTTNDTVPVSFLCQSLWTYQHIIYGVEDTATMNVIVILQENAFDSGNDDKWYEVERDTLISGTNPVILNGGNDVNDLAYVKGKRQRIILDGVTSATQDVSTTTRSILKKPAA